MNTLLQLKNTHERDNNIEFEENKHIYTINGQKNYTSVTTFVHSNFEKFNSENIITNMMKSKIGQIINIMAKLKMKLNYYGKKMDRNLHV